MKQLAATVALSFAFAPWPALADQGEFRISAVGSVPGFASLKQSGGEASSAVWGGGVRLARGVRDWLELGGSVRFVTASSVRFKNATVLGLRGDLYTDLYVLEPTLGPRLIGPTLVHVGGIIRPFAELGGGLVVRSVTSGPAFDPKDRLIDHPDGETSYLAALTLAGGLEWRIRDAYAIGLGIDWTECGDDYRSVGIAVELSWIGF
jgi:hypothetical protein